MKRLAVLLHLAFAVIVAIELAGRLTGQIQLEYSVKPLIVIWIAIYFLIFRQKRSFTVPVLLALFFSWIGDILLMFSGMKDLFFYGGVGGFFIAQLAYIYTFIRYRERPNPGFLQKNRILGLFFLAYGGGIYYLLYPGLEGLMRPVILLYAVSLIAMSMTALNRKDRVNRSSYILVFTGSVLFVLSDSMIALDRFYRTIPLAGFWIMATYISAQYLIMRGLIRERETLNSENPEAVAIRAGL